MKRIFLLLLTTCVLLLVACSKENNKLYTDTVSKIEINNTDSLVKNMLRNYSKGEYLGFYEQ